MNYMDRFHSPEEYIRAMVLSNRGTQNIIDKKDLAAMAGIPADKIPSYKKDDILGILVEQKGSDIYRSFPVGVEAKSWIEKFGITRSDLKKLAEHGYIAVTETRKFHKWGRTNTAELYDPYAYFELTGEQIREWLETIKVRRKK